MALTTDFQFCCTASILYGFGQEDAADWAARYEGNGKTLEQTRSSIIERVKAKRDGGDGIITAITTNNQTNAIKVLTELGFSNSGEIHKKRHPENTICLWWLALKDWKEPVVEKPVEKVENPFGKVGERNNFIRQHEDGAEAQRIITRDARGRFANAPRRFIIVDEQGREYGLISGRVRMSRFNNIPTAVFESEQDFFNRTGKSVEQVQQFRRSRRWNNIRIKYI